MPIEIIVGPLLFALGAFFIMLPYVGLRFLGVALIGFAAISGMLTGDAFDWSVYMVFGAFTVIALTLGTWLGLRLTDARLKEHHAVGEERELMVPYAQDGTWFHPGVAFADGRYRIGQKGEEKAIRSYNEALKMLRAMPVACWRRPSPRTGLYGLVSASHWGRPPEHATRQSRLAQSSRK